MSASPPPSAPSEERTSARPLLIFLIMVCTAMIVSYAARLDDRDSVEAAIVTQQALNEQAKARTAELQKELAEVNRPAYVDEVARGTLGLGKEGDVVIVPVNPATLAAGQAAPAAATSRPALPIWRQWLHLFAPDS